MHLSQFKSEPIFRKASQTREFRRFLVYLVIFGLLIQAGCLFRKRQPKAAPALPAPVRFIMFPLNVPPGNNDLRWASLASTVHMAEAAVAAPDLEPVPLWESMPAVLQTLGVSRGITPEIAEFTAARLAARWAAQGDVLLANSVITLRIDFIPSKASLVPFRYEKSSALDSMAPRFQEGFDQFLHYLIVRPLAKDKLRPLDVAKLKEIAQALDVEYGWFTPAKPAAAGKIVEELASSNREAARLLFNPALYPVLAK